MPDDTTAPFPFPAVSRKKITAAFDGGRLSSDGGVMLLAQAERRLGIAERLARFIPDERDPARVRHAVADNCLLFGEDTIFIQEIPPSVLLHNSRRHPRGSRRCHA